MPTFEVTITSPDDAPLAGGVAEAVGGVRVVVEAAHWIDAWREGLRVLGEGAAPPSAECDVREDQSVRVWLPDRDRAWLVRPVAEPPHTAAARPAPGTAALVVADHGDAETPSTAFRVMPARAPAPPTRSPLRRSPHTPPPAAACQSASTTDTAAAPAPSTDAARPVPPPPAKKLTGSPSDPIARRLRTDEQARLAPRDRSGMRVAVPSLAPEPPKTDARGRRQAESTRVGRPASGGRAPLLPAPNGVSATTSDFHAIASESEHLPQQFRAITLPPPGTPGIVAAAQEAVENAWQHIPCQLAQALRRRDDGHLEVVAARGERERESLSCRVAVDPSLERWLAQGPARVKYAEDRARLRYLTLRADLVLEVPVRSAICVPVRLGETRWGVLLLVNSTRATGFAEGEMRAVSYLGTTLARALTE